MTNVAAVISSLDHFQHRVIQDAMAEATAHYWPRRAEQFAARYPTEVELSTTVDSFSSWTELRDRR